jgi:hypothetical protein
MSAGYGVKYQRGRSTKLEEEGRGSWFLDGTISLELRE